eukprot:GHUV01023733.1.p1 GENE.GHUV01023733.1~~GHUV01023733.1.p1  ORF type:complete len:166 (+),score=31.63 GHUV01023733.1:130-627(+)
MWRWSLHSAYWALLQRLCSSSCSDTVADHPALRQQTPRQDRPYLSRPALAFFEYTGSLNQQILPHHFVILLFRIPCNRVPQDFPYYFEDNVQHWLLWSTSGPLSHAAIEQETRQKFPDMDYLIFVNPAALQSIRDIWHCHVLVRPKQTEQEQPQQQQQQQQLETK